MIPRFGYGDRLCLSVPALGPVPAAGLSGGMELRVVTIRGRSMTMKRISQAFSKLAAVVMVLGLMFVHAATGPAKAAGFEELTKQGKFEDVLDDLKSAIINRGFVIDYVGHFNKMLERTSETVGSVTAAGAKSPYSNAQYLQFCAAKLTHDAISANPQNIVNCPYVVYIYELTAKAGLIHVGYRTPVTDASKISRRAVGKIGDLLNAIIKEAAE